MAEHGIDTDYGFWWAESRWLTEIRSLCSGTETGESDIRPRLAEYLRHLGREMDEMVNSPEFYKYMDGMWKIETWTKAVFINLEMLGAEFSTDPADHPREEDYQGCVYQVFKIANQVLCSVERDQPFPPKSSDPFAVGVASRCARFRFQTVLQWSGDY